MIRFIIIDDEPIAHKIIESFAKDLPHLHLQANCHNAMEAMEYLQANDIDLMFLDINMPKMKGLDFLKLLKNPPSVIITTAYEEFALEGYELNVIDYLLKPFSFERFTQAIYRVQQSKPKVETVVKTISKEEPESIFIKGDKRHIQVALNEITCIESIGSYCKVITKEETIITHEKISNFEKILDSNNFIRVHKSFIVSKRYIKSIEGNRILILDKHIPIGQTYKLNLKKVLKY
ncbi:LytR/AlgR family response regulator transcription factor [Winogradskyella flava]|uniref:Response regulator transcription factor n=1 Tax=Winogradskyella flava TaxID=1884876 RepID=A0A842IWR3_9FLAO|nr:LytTR family DNA-binding domain-containing protein [Winogradskyella flava]MBC2845228.1 response regulator transcription factor [Winogradskyella flava]